MTRRRRVVIKKGLVFNTRRIALTTKDLGGGSLKVVWSSQFRPIRGACFDSKIMLAALISPMPA
jgi:hypothetical protein